MTVDEILEMWKKDSPIDEIELDTTSMETAKLHGKYLELLTVAKLQLKRLNLKIASLKKDKWYLYFTVSIPIKSVSLYCCPSFW